MLNLWPSGRLDLISGILIKLLRFARHHSSAVGACLRVSVVVKRHHGHGNFNKGKLPNYSSEVQSVIIMTGHGGMQAAMPEKELNILHP